MARIHFHIETRLAPEAVLAVLTDFGPRRAKVWPNIDDQHFRVHGQGPGWADVTEGSSIAGGVWEREKYAWDAAEGHVAVETVDSNTWGPGCSWREGSPLADGAGVSAISGLAVGHPRRAGRGLEPSASRSRNLGGLDKAGVAFASWLHCWRL